MIRKVQSDTNALSETEPVRFQRLQAGLDLLDQGITVIDSDLKMLAWNRTFLTLLEFPPEMAYVGASFESFIRYNAERGEYGDGDVDAQVRVRVNAARAFQPHYTERQRPDGRTLAIRGEPIGQHGFVTLYTDITEQRRYEQLMENQNVELEQKVRSRTRELELANHDLRYVSRENQRIATALRRNEERMRTITDNVAALIGYFDDRQIYGFANERHKQWFGRGRDALLGCHVVDILGEEAYSHVEPYIKRGLAGETVTFEYDSRGNNNEVMHSRCTLVPEFGPDRSVSGCYVLAIDVTEQKRAELAVREAQKMEVIGQLAGGLAHDFNNILTVIIGNISALADADGEKNAHDEYTKPALRAAQRGAELVRRLLTVARQQPLETHPVDVGALIIGLVPLLRGSLPESIAIRTRLGPKQGSAPPAYWAQVDPGQIENALINLALNARDAMPDGGTLEIGCQRTCAESGSGASGDWIEISVADSGLGMDEATQARAFDPFFTTKGFGRGSGLGLAMVQGFVQQSGGMVDLSSTPGKGTSIRLKLPVASPLVECASDREQPADINGDEALVLLVEDDQDVRNVVRGQLTAIGHSVLEAEDAVEAIELLKSVEGIRIVVSDIVMPGGMDGYQLADVIEASNADVGIVLMSGYPGESRLGAGGRKAFEFLAKPFSADELRAALRRSIA